MSTTAKLLKRPAKNLPCVSLIGMAGCGKTTVGLALAKALGWAFMDT
ncbi:MAG: shikimate kinase, partial [Desulfovibrio sp.]|nr:shikimate kinase [Desulfovibrio sp.]